MQHARFKPHMVGRTFCCSDAPPAPPGARSRGGCQTCQLCCFALEHPCRPKTLARQRLHYQRAGQGPCEKRQSTPASVRPLLAAGSAPHASGGASSLRLREVGEG